MLTEKYIQLIGNMVANNLIRRYPQLDIKFFSGKRGDMMRVYITQRDDQRQLTGRLYDIEKNPGLETRWVKDHAERIETKMLEAVKRFLGPAQGVQVEETTAPGQATSGEAPAVADSSAPPPTTGGDEARPTVQA